MKRAITLCITARKGGVGRSPSCQNLAGAAAEMGARVLLIDHDPQGSLSKNFFGPNAVDRLQPKETAAALYDADISDYSSIVRQTDIREIALVAANDHLEQYDSAKYDEAEAKSQFVLRDFVDSVVDQYDLIIVDTPPNAGTLLARAAWNACQYSLTIIKPTKNSIEAIPAVKMRIAAIINSTNPHLVDIGCLITDAKPNKIHRLAEKTVRQLYGDQIFKTVILCRTDYEQATAALKPITHYKPKSELAEMFRQALNELAAKISDSRNAFDEVEERVANE